ncbi:ERI1 exoribonuclease 3-like [Lycorma delicatula]|uniref:ERI1 exoribonuclease 3-like n=1 Tax=Lycorma delicatula TaxID=130591 RepID=UPI003F515F7D
MNRVFKYCVGYITVNNLFCHCYVRERGFIYNVTLRKYGSSTTSSILKKFAFPKQDFDAFLVLDFESTCLPGHNALKQQEIIEFPCAWVNSSDFKDVKIFHRYVKPKICTALDPFCSHLTGITTQMLENEKHFDVVLNDFQKWFYELKESTRAKDVIFVTCGDWDLKVMLPEQCRLSKVEVPKYMKKWLNIKREFSEVTTKYPKNLKQMLNLFHLQHHGRLHRGLDDTLSIVKILTMLAQKGHVFTLNEYGSEYD